eukprot:GHVN01066783.1.p1 GENE.GHVN01066783.1~~GHVN01066783.1.p1  ORF type:complete len:605 (-),score=26.36 GHVN01066783.1:721-2535(-)
MGIIRFPLPPALLHLLVPSTSQRRLPHLLLQGRPASKWEQLWFVHRGLCSRTGIVTPKKLSLNRFVKTIIFSIGSLFRLSPCPQTTCPSGSTDYSGRCLTFKAPHYRCSEGSLIGHSCKVVETAPKLEQCPAGSVDNGASCDINIVSMGVCNEGETDIGGECAELHPVGPICPDGYTLRGAICSSEEWSEAETTCPSGTYPSGSGSCQATTSTEPRIWTCPSGYSSSGGLCSTTETVDKITACVNGQDPNDRCRRQVPVELTPYCEAGKLVNGVCVTKEHEPAQPICPAGYSLAGSACQKTTTYDCSVEVEDVVCDERPQGKGHVRALGGAPKAKYSAAVPPVCHKVSRVEPKTCEKIITAQPEMTCATGYSTNGSTCEVTVSNAPSYKCNAESQGNGGCYATEFSNPITVCPDGYTKSGSQCSRTSVAPQVSSCPVNTAEPDCATFSEKLPGSENVVYAAATVSCPEGFHLLKAAAWGRNQGRCVKAVFEAPTYGCPNGQTQVNRFECANPHPKMSTQSDQHVPKQHTCPSGWYENRDSCHREVSAPAVPYCADGSEIYNGACATEVGALTGCPDGSSEAKGQCWVRSTVSPIPVETVVCHNC